MTKRNASSRGSAIPVGCTSMSYNFNSAPIWGSDNEKRKRAFLHPTVIPSYMVQIAKKEYYRPGLTMRLPHELLPVVKQRPGRPKSKCFYALPLNVWQRLILTSKMQFSKQFQSYDPCKAKHVTYKPLNS